MSLVGKPIPDFALTAFTEGAFRSIDSAELRGHWLLLLFLPGVFTPVCASEVLAFSSCARWFRERDCEPLAISTDSKLVLRVWAQAPAEAGGLAGGATIPLLADITKNVARDFGVLEEDEGTPVRALFLVDPAGRIVHESACLSAVGRSTVEARRLLAALQHLAAQPNRVCSADWQERDPSLDASAG
jgi:alkyl hydroperoxide reductase subunit AhpC